MKESPEQLGRRLREQREQLGLNVRQFEPLMGVGHLYIEALESGDYAIFKQNSSELSRCLRLYSKKLNLAQLSQKKVDPDQGTIEI